MRRRELSNPIVENQAPRARALRSLRQYIESGRIRSGDVLPPERVLCEMLEVSRGTLRRVLEALEKEGLVSPMNGGKTRTVAERTADNNSLKPQGEAIALLSPNAQKAIEGHRQSGWADFIALGALQEIQRAGLNAMTVGGGSFSEKDLEWILRWRPYGVVIPELHKHPAQELLERLAHAGIRSVIYSGAEELAAFDRVSSDHETGTYDLTKWFLDRGRRRIAMVWGKEEIPSYWHLARLRGYERAMKEAGLSPLPSIVYSPDYFDPASQEGFEARARYFVGWLARPLSGSKPVDTILAQTDGNVPALATACQILGLKPNKDVWLGGYDNYWQDTIERAWCPIVPMVTVDKQNWQIGQQLVKLLLDRVADKFPSEPQWQLVPQKLIEIDQASAGNTVTKGNPSIPWN
jgi:DNA-binding LacI/PurR family transcriptional regulator